MTALFHFLQAQFPTLFTYKYFFLFAGAALEGFNTLILGGFLLAIGKVRLVPTFLLFVSGGFINGWLWYLVGFFAGAKPIDKWIIRDEKKRKVIDRIRGYFERYSGRALILTRMTLSFTVATLIMAGSLKYSPKKFSLYNLIGATGWVVITMTAGYFFGESYKHIFIYIANITYTVILLAVFIAFIYLVRILFKSAFVKSLLINEKLKEMGEKIKEGIDDFLSEGGERK